MVRIVLPSGGQPGQQIVVNAPDGQQVRHTHLHTPLFLCVFSVTGSRHHHSVVD